MKKNYTSLLNSLKGNLANFGLVLACIGSALPSGVSAQGQTYTFTTGGATGPTAPTNAQLNTAYGSTNLNGMVTYTNGIQSFTVPQTAPYRIIAIGAQGGYNGGKGAYVSGDYTLTAGTVIKILVGQQGTTADNNSTNGGFGNAAGGGGGGSYVSSMTNVPYVVAGGGGGNGDGYNGFHNAAPCCQNGMEASLTNAGNGNAPSTTGGTPGGNGGSGGNGGTCNGFSTAGSGAGFFGNGSACNAGSSAISYTNGGAAGTGNTSGIAADGGFGGGGGVYNSGTGERGGGGGGYSGGGGGIANTGYDAAGGGGGSFLSGTNQTASLTANTGDGKVMITLLCDVAIAITHTNSSSALPASICSGNSLTLTTNAASNYSWSTGSTATAIVVSPTITTTYTVVGTSSIGCSNAAAVTVTVSGNTPTLSVVNSTNSACIGQSVTTTASGALTYTWSNGVANGAVFFPSTTATYTVVGGNGCGTSSAVTTVSVAMLPVTIVASPTLVCSGSNATLTASGANTYTWMPGSTTSATFIPHPTSTTVYTVTGLLNTCYGVSVVTITTKPVPTVSISVTSTAICNGATAILNAVGSTATYSWSTNQPGPSISVSPTNTTVYSVIATNSVNCTTPAAQVIVVNPNPVIGVSTTSLEICPGASATLTASGATTYTWANNGANTSTNVVHPTTTTIFNVTGAFVTGCNTTSMITINVPQPTVAVSSNTSVCIGSNVTLTGSEAETYTWSTGVFGPNAIVSPTVNTTYTVTGFTSSPFGLLCPASTTVSVNVNALPVITASAANGTICSGQSTTLTASGATTYTWTNSLGNTAAITVTPGINQMYNVYGTDANGCKNTAVTQVIVARCTGINSISANATNMIIYPNPSNGEFTISADQNITLNIVNELGQQVRTITLNSSTPEVKVSNLANGVYFVTGSNENGSVKQKIVIAK